MSRGASCRLEEEVGLLGKGRHTDAIFSFLTGGRISEACQLAQKGGEEEVLGLSRDAFKALGKRSTPDAERGFCDRTKVRL